MNHSTGIMHNSRKVTGRQGASDVYGQQSIRCGQRGIIMGFVKQTKMVVAMSGSAECSFAVYSSQLLKSIEQKFKETQPKGVVYVLILLWPSEHNACAWSVPLNNKDFL